MSYKNPLLLTTVTIVLFLTGCAANRTSSTMPEYRFCKARLEKRDYAGQIEAIDRNKQEFYKDKDKVQYLLDMGLLLHYDGDYIQSNTFLTDAEKEIENLYTHSIARGLSAFIINDMYEDYRGEDYEDVYINIFKALNYMQLGQSNDALVEMRSLDQKLKMLQHKYEPMPCDTLYSGFPLLQVMPMGFNNSAWGRWLSLLLYKEQNYCEDVAVDYRLLKSAFSEQPDVYDFPFPFTDTITQPTMDAKLDLVVLSGLGPQKISLNHYFDVEKNGKAAIHIQTIADNKVADEWLNFDSHWSGNELRGYFYTPDFQSRQTKVASIKVWADGTCLPAPDLLENVDNVARATFSTKYPYIFASTFTRAVLKQKFAKITQKWADDNPKSVTLGVLSIISTVHADHSEAADLRVSNYWPKNVYVGEYCLVPGKHNIRVDYCDVGGKVLFSDDLGMVTVTAGQLNLKESCLLK